MATQTMRRHASDNEYLHRDFHGALSAAIDYLDERYGEDAVRDYLREFTTTFYAPLIQQIAEQGLAPLRDHFQRVYEREGGAAEFRLTEDELVLRVTSCPAVTHMRRNGYPVARLWVETTRTVNEALCEGTPFAPELLEYDEQTGASVQRFYRRAR